jgi:hypothetical protein
VFENRVLRRIFGPKKEEMAGGWRRLHNEGLNISYVSPNIISMIKSRKMGWAGHVMCMGDMRNIYKVLVIRTEEKRPLGRSRYKWEDGIRMGHG